MMITSLMEVLQSDPTKWNTVRELLVIREIAPKTILLNAGEISNEIHFVKKGCLRQWFNKDGKDITFQFFFDGQPVASLDSFLHHQPSLFSIESIEPSEILSLNRENFLLFDQLYPEFQKQFQELLFLRFKNYAQLFLSRIKDTPRERYDDLLKNHPEIIQRVPQHYIASYLGITPVSLSRIRNRK